MDITLQDEYAFDLIRSAAKIILELCKEPDDVIEINRFLAELEPYPSFVITIEEVK